MADDSRPDPELLRLCFISGQMPESAWIEHVRRGDVEDEMTEDLMTSQRHAMTTPDKDFAAAVEIARREERERGEATLSEVLRVVAPFLAIRDQALADMLRLISKASDGFAPISVTVTKAQFLEAHTLRDALRARAAQERTA